MTQSKSWAERREEAGDVYCERGKGNAQLIKFNGFIKGADFGYRAALEDMGAVVDIFNYIRLDTFTAHPSHIQQLCMKALDIFARLKKEVVGND